ncbi:uncharacterized protein LOC120704595 [Panicum virgatum]|uniref:Uncharacterized protein n=1 Tax=Panicum virgatum TaxID=38727 RepID=A0A8T0U2I9_PANVG|nr:uncharacterized protein LOC120704595 [Panicum virgatum]KAG2614449.1 hypothetical protein PVAP13_4KG364701 [Panicum virgatum]
MRNNKTPAVALVCLQAQHVAGLPAAAEGRQVLLRLLQQQQVAAATCREGVAAFHDRVLLLDCAPVGSMDMGDLAVAVAVTVGDTARAAVVDVNLAEQLRRPSPRVLRFVLGGSAAGAVLCLTLHHRRLMARRRGCTAALLSCLRMSPPPAPEEARGNGMDDDDDESSSGFITIDKGTISRRRPPSDTLVTSDDDEGPSPTSVSVKEEEDSNKVVEDEFLAMLMLEVEGDALELDLDALIEDAGRLPFP